MTGKPEAQGDAFTAAGCERVSSIEMLFPWPPPHDTDVRQFQR